MAFSGIFVVFFMLFGGLGGNEALDYVDTKSYWKEQGEQPAEEALIQEVSKPQVKEGAPAKASEIRKLMVIRTLGEMKSKVAVKALEQATKSEERFVAGYAKEALAAINGEKADYPKVDGGDKKDMLIMPKDTGVFVHATMKSGPAQDIAKELKKALPEQQQAGADMMLSGMQKGLITFLEKSGNIRIDTASVGVAQNVGDEAGWAVLSLRGEYDHAALRATILEMAGGDFNQVKIGGVDYLSPEDEVFFAPLSDEHFILMTGPGKEQLPLESMGKALAGEVKEVAMPKDLQDLIAKTEKKGNLWAAALVSGEMKKVPHLKEFKNLRMETAKDGEFTEVLVIGEGEQANKVQQALTAIEELHAEFVDKEVAQMKEHMPPGMKPMADFIEGIEFRGRGDLAIVSGKLKDINPLNMLTGMFLFQAPMHHEHGDLEVE
ncbi:hypothetical protein Rhal01_00822 [Rubritalea halochordaticola]|uniref:DUF3352 domain-containing protein n=1 Tax=Rubritalea halochordaticola TaxID=714537 RepID=A0ABP9UZ69_9BACT